jgi:2-amino-4-hydroxy-6-hydroxymethyldihydropteridine diphosphokinase
MAVLARLERDFGRLREAANAPRTLDLDLIAHGRAVIEDPGLILPHPRAHERRFVMGPLAEIAPAWRHPVSGASAAELAFRAEIGADAAPLGYAALRKGEQNAI